jgi:hypothetical protein
LGFETSSAIDAVVGEPYVVPCVQVDEVTVYPNEFLRPGELIPVLAPAHEDAQFFNFPHRHYHIDFRFVDDDLWERLRQSPTVHSCVVAESLLARPDLQWLRLRCRRMMPEFPAADAIPPDARIGDYEGLVVALCEMETHYLDTRIDTETLVCPHRRICLKGLPVQDGVVVCPGHGLAWNVVTGALVTRHSQHPPSPEAPRYTP